MRRPIIKKRSWKVIVKLSIDDSTDPDAIDPQDIMDNFMDDLRNDKVTVNCLLTHKVSKNQLVYQFVPKSRKRDKTKPSFSLN